MSAPFNILILDTNVKDARRIESLLRSAFSSGVDVISAADVESARSHLAIRDIHLAITSLSLPPFTGAGVVEHLRRVRPALPVICVADQHDQGMALAVMAAGAATLIDKSELTTSTEPLTRAVVSVLTEARRRAEANGLVKQIDAIHNLLQQTHEHIHRLVAASEQHADLIDDNRQKIDRIDTVVRNHETNRRHVLALLWAVATAALITLAERLF